MPLRFRPDGNTRPLCAKTRRFYKIDCLLLVVNAKFDIRVTNMHFDSAVRFGLVRRRPIKTPSAQGMGDELVIRLREDFFFDHQIGFNFADELL